MWNKRKESKKKKKRKEFPYSNNAVEKLILIRTMGFSAANAHTVVAVQNVSSLGL